MGGNTKDEKMLEQSISDVPFHVSNVSDDEDDDGQGPRETKPDITAGCPCLDLTPRGLSVSVCLGSLLF